MPQEQSVIAALYYHHLTIQVASHLRARSPFTFFSWTVLVGTSLPGLTL